jgi:hypothetical protein
LLSGFPVGSADGEGSSGSWHGARTYKVTMRRLAGVHATRSIKPGSLFLTFPTRALTGHRVISPAG